MPSFVTRNLLICVVPTVIALFSVYWFRKKKKLKAVLIESSNSQTVLVREVSNDTRSACSDSADTLSDASSLTSPESSEKSLRTKYSSLVSPSKDVFSGELCNSSSSSSLKSIELNHVDSSKMNESSATKLDGILSHSNVLNNRDESVLNDSKTEDSVLESSDIHDDDQESRLNDLNASTREVFQVKTEMVNLGSSTDTLLKIIDLYDSNKRRVVNGSLQSDGSNESADVSSQLSDMEKLQAVETDSNDSHSSVLDENSLSYVSDDSECRQPVVKDSLSSVLDENSSLCDESPQPSALSPKGSSGSKENELVPSFQELSLVPNHIKTKMQIDDGHNCSTMNSHASVRDDEEDEHSDAAFMNDESVDSKLSSSESPKADDSPPPHSSAESQRHCNESSSKALASCDSRHSETNFSISSSPPEEEASSKSNGDVVNSVQIESHEDAASLGATCDNSAENPDTCQTLLKEPLECAMANQNSAQAVVWKNGNCQLDVANQSKQQMDDVDGSKTPSSSSSSANYVYEFELPQELCGRLIGKGGKHVKSIKDRSNANVFIKRHPFDHQLKLVVVEGIQSDVMEALEIIRRKYPLSRYPMVTLVKTNTISASNILPESLQMHLPEGSSCDVILSSLISANHFFLQQPTHPTYPSLSTLDQCMASCYSQMDTPLLPHPVEPGVICAAPIMNGWYRAQVIYICDSEAETVGLKFVDYGGFADVSVSSLRQIRSDFMSLPFQASECYLANVQPVDHVGWSSEARAKFEELAQGQILQSLLVEYAPDGVPCVHLYRVQGASSVFINQELVDQGLAQWVNSSNQWATAT